ncbi:MAG: HAMP domain-containing protein, partial [Dehalococcoidales bacterium]|nr:HAMP domain-containing protein [Dehalococcoidales bacterium]
MIHKLQFRLLLAFVAVIIIAIGTVSIFVYQNTGGQLQQYGQQALQDQTARYTYVFSSYYARNLSWDGVQDGVDELSKIDHQKIIITGLDGQIIAATDHNQVGKTYTNSTGIPMFIRLQVAGGMIMGPQMAQQIQVGVLYANPENIPYPITSDLANRITRFLIIGGLMAIAIALIITVILSRRISAPVKELTNKARQFGQGDFSQRVPYEGKGEIGELATAFNSMADDLQRMETLRRDMVADTAHELRTPLSNIKGYLEAIRDG